MLGIKKDFYTSSLINMKTKISGNIESNSEIVVNGEVKGDINANEIKIGKTGFVYGFLTADKITIAGKIEGDVRAKSIFLTSTARIYGDIYHNKISIETGALINGMLKEEV